MYIDFKLRYIYIIANTPIEYVGRIYEIVRGFEGIEIIKIGKPAGIGKELQVAFVIISDGIKGMIKGIRCEYPGAAIHIGGQRQGESGRLRIDGKLGSALCKRAEHRSGKRSINWHG